MSDLKVTINSKGLVYSVILLLASVTLTVSARVDTGPRFSWFLPSPDLPPPVSAGSVRPSELLEVGPQVGTLPRSALRSLPPLLRRLREPVENVTHACTIGQSGESKLFTAVIIS